MKRPKDRFQKCLIHHNQHFHESLSEADFIKRAEVKPAFESGEVSKRERRNLARLERRKAKSFSRAADDYSGGNFGARGAAISNCA